MTPKPQEKGNQDVQYTKREQALKRRFGASDEIGHAFAVQLAQYGFDLILIARRGNVLQEMALDLGSGSAGMCARLPWTCPIPQPCRN